MFPVGNMVQLAYGATLLIPGVYRGVFAVDFAPGEQKLAIAGGDSSIRILDVVNRGYSGHEGKEEKDQE